MRQAATTAWPISPSWGVRAWLTTSRGRKAASCRARLTPASASRSATVATSSTGLLKLVPCMTSLQQPLVAEHLGDGAHPPPEGRLDEAVGVLDGGRLGDQHQHPVVGDQEEVEGVGVGAGAEVEDDVVGVEGLDVAEQPELLGVAGLGRLEVVEGPGDQREVLHAGGRPAPPRAARSAAPRSRRGSASATPCRGRCGGWRRRGRRRPAPPACRGAPVRCPGWRR